LLIIDSEQALDISFTGSARSEALILEALFDAGKVGLDIFFFFAPQTDDD
jgi:hypothetical protein